VILFGFINPTPARLASPPATARHERAGESVAGRLTLLRLRGGGIALAQIH
jgi:hypothetical protein